MLTENEMLRQRYEAREKAYRDAIWVERDHRRRLDETRARLEEIREGSLQRGELIGRIHLCQRLLEQPSSPMQELEDLALDDLEAFASQLESKLSG